MPKGQFSSSLVEVAFWFLWFNFSNINPSITIEAQLSFAEDVVLQYLLMFIFGGYGVKRILFL